MCEASPLLENLVVFVFSRPVQSFSFVSVRFPMYPKDNTKDMYTLCLAKKVGANCDEIWKREKLRPTSTLSSPSLSLSLSAHLSSRVFISVRTPSERINDEAHHGQVEGRDRFGASDGISNAASRRKLVRPPLPPIPDRAASN